LNTSRNETKNLEEKKKGKLKNKERVHSAKGRRGL